MVVQAARRARAHPCQRGAHRAVRYRRLQGVRRLADACVSRVVAPSVRSERPASGERVAAWPLRATRPAARCGSLCAPAQPLGAGAVECLAGPLPAWRAAA